MSFDQLPAMSGPAQARLQRIENGKACLELIKEGHSYGDVAEGLGLQVDKVKRLVKRALDEHAAPDVEAVRGIEDQRIQTAMRAIYGRVKEGDLRAIDRYIRLCALRMTLMGCAAPPRDGREEHDDDRPRIVELLPYSESEQDGAVDAAAPPDQGTSGTN